MFLAATGVPKIHGAGHGPSKSNHTVKPYEESKPTDETLLASQVTTPVQTKD
jgi:hypothetical protein